MVYLVIFRNDGGHIFSAATLEAEGDREAVERARAIYRTGIAHRYEIRQENRHVHTELCAVPSPARSSKSEPAPPAPPMLSNEYLARAVECQRLASLTQDCVLREQLMGLRKGCLDVALHVARREVRGAPAYWLNLYDGGDEVLAREPLDAEDEDTAVKIAAIIFDACSDVSTHYDVLRGDATIEPARRRNGSFAPGDLQSQAQQIVLEREIALRDSRTSLAESRRLLAKTDEWASAILT